MDLETARKRGWSMQSDQTNEEGSKNNDDLDENEKKRLFEEYPTHMAQSNDEDDTDITASETRTESGTKEGVQNDDSAAQKATRSIHTLELAKSRLSKWAARLFDPDRPRGLIEPPQTIPLNDEFLTDFGKREKEFDASMGRRIDIDKSILKDHDESDDDQQQLQATQAPAAESEPLSMRKVKITNLTYTTSHDTLEAACQTYGPLEQVNLIMDKERTDRNIGRAYVTFETADGAQACLEQLTTLQGRKLRVTLAVELPRKSTSSGGSAPLARYWEKDITTKCFRCGQVGHMEASCPNEAKPKPCHLCAQLGHDSRNCAISRICFRCGVPGHINRDCTYRQNLPRRMVCGICFQSGHHRSTCRRRATDAPSHDAKCMVCGKRGHFMCTTMKWFFGLESLSCFNCGRSGHHGYDCRRPTIDMCNRDEQVVQREIDRAAAESVADALEQQRDRGRQQQRGRSDRRDQDRGRAKSQDPRTMYRPSSSEGSRGYAVSNERGEQRGRSRQDDNRNAKRQRR